MGLYFKTLICLSVVGFTAFANLQGIASAEDAEVLDEVTTDTVAAEEIRDPVPGDDSMILEGEALELASATFEARCSLCHGSDGKGEGEASLNLMDEIWHHGGTLDEIAQTISEGVPDTLMKPQKEKLTAEEIADLARYVKVLAREMHAGTDPSGLAAASELTDMVSSGLPAPQNYVEVERVNFIDDYIFDKMKADDIPHAGLSSDQEFMRRLYFDLWGRIPEPAVVREFIADTDPEKRNKLIDKLLCLDKIAAKTDAEKEVYPEPVIEYWKVDEPYLSKWRFFFEDLFRNFFNGRQEIHDSFRNFINLFLKYNHRYDGFVREIITASSITGRSSGSSGYLVQARMGGPGEGDPIHEDICDEIAIRTTRNFLGVNLGCISCHDGEDHLEDVNLWLSKRKRVEFWRQAAFFGETGFNIHPGGGPKQPYFIEDGMITAGYLASAESKSRTPRDKTADVYPAYLTNQERPAEGTNPRVDFARRLTTDFQFAKVAVNLFWSKFMVVGIVDPPFDWDLARQDPDNPPPAPWTLQPSHPKLLDALAKDFVEHKYDLRRLMRTICRSHAYQLSSHFDGEYNPEYDRYFARKLVRRLSAEEVYDAIAKSTNIFGHTAAANPNWKSGYSMDLPSPLSGLQQCDGELREFLFFFGRGNRNTSEPNTNTSMIHTSVMLYSKIVKNKVKADAEGSLTNTLLTEYPPWTWSGSDNLKKLIEEVFLATLTRLPTAKEMTASIHHIEKYRDKGIENLQWALFNKIEFMVNY